VVNGGVLRADPRPINVQGDYTQRAAGTLQLTLAGSAPGQYDFLNVGGHATLNGTLQLISLKGFQPKAGDRFTLVTAGGGLSGQFADIVDSFNGLPRSVIELFYGTNTFVLEVFQAPFTSFALTPNQAAVANQLDKVQGDPRAAQLIGFLDGEPNTNLPADFEKISPDELTAFYEVTFSAPNIQVANLEQRFAEIRNGSSGFSSSLKVSNVPPILSDGKEGKTVIVPSTNAPSSENRWGVWISGTGDYVNVSSDGNGTGYDFTTSGVTFGLDYRLTKSLAVGIAGGYARTWTDLTRSGNIDVDSGRGGVYTTFHRDGFYLNGFAGGSYNSYYARRDGLGGGARGSTNAGEFDSYVGCGYEFHYQGLTFGPIASLQYTYLNLGEYGERGSLAPLTVVSQSQGSLRTSLGLSVSHSWKVGNVQLRPSLQARWQHEYFYSSLPIEARFASGAGSEFTVNGPAEGHDSALIDAGLHIQWTPTIGIYLGYNGQVGRRNYDSQTGMCSVQIDF
jgi:outer membrane autotransporter protein